jgi:hypothetical protein
MTHGAIHGPELMTSLVSFVAAILKQGELSLHEAVTQVAKEHNANLNTVRRAYSRAQVSKERAHGRQPTQPRRQPWSLQGSNRCPHGQTLSHITSGPSDIRNVLQFVAASGRVWMVVYIFQKLVGQKSEPSR